MRYWWVNQNQTYRQEIGGGYLWSPKRNSNGARNPFYESMREVSPGDLVFSFVDTRIKAVGIVQSHCYECPKPSEFGAAGMNWDKVGWRVDVRFKEEPMPIRPMDHMDTLRAHLPARYAPLQANGYGLQGVYLTQLPLNFAEALAGLMGRPILDLVRGNVVMTSAIDPAIADALPTAALQWEDALIQRIRADTTIAETEKAALVLARRGQGLFKSNVRRLEFRCRVTQVDRLEHLRASHCKPWRDSSNEERIDGENGLLLTPTVDHLFDRGFISFEGDGRLLVSPVAHPQSLQRMGIQTDEAINVGAFSSGQKRYLEYHREHVFLSRSQR